MGQTLTEIAQALKDSPKKVQLIYAFNGTGKTRLSREFRLLVNDRREADEAEDVESTTKILYYNAFTEDLFYWDNDLPNDAEPKLKIQANAFIHWILEDEGQDQNIIDNFQYYTDDKLTPNFSEDYAEIRFSFERGNDEHSEYVKVSKGEESCFIWSVFHSLIEQSIDVLNTAEPDERSTDKFNELEYIFIDDPVSSLDDTHLIELAVNISRLVKSSESDLKFVITTHNPLFYNVLHNELKNSGKYRLEKFEDGTYDLLDQKSDSPFSYHLFLLSELERAIESREIQKYHFNFLRNILEKTSTFLGYDNWRKLLPEESREAYYNRIINLSSHSKHTGDEVSAIQDSDKRVLGYLVEEVKTAYRFNSSVS